MPAVSAALRKANSKQKPFMLHVFTKMIAKAYNSKPKQVEVRVIPKYDPNQARERILTLRFLKADFDYFKFNNIPALIILFI